MLPFLLMASAKHALVMASGH